MLSLKLSKDVGKGSKAENKGKKEKKRLRIAQLNDKDVFGWVSLFTGDGSKTDEDGSRVIKVRQAGDSDSPTSSPLPHLSLVEALLKSMTWSWDPAWCVILEPVSPT